MRILLLSNFFPPLHLGGYEELAADVAAALRERGHRVDVLTSNLRACAAPPDPSVHRVLHLEIDLRPGRGTLGFFAGRRRRAAIDAARLRDTIALTRPDVLLVFGMWNLPRPLLALAEGWHLPPLVYYVADYWPALPDAYALHWQASAARRWTRLPKAVLAEIIRRLYRPPPPPALAFAHAVCVSYAVRARLIDAGLPFTNAGVIHNGIDLRCFPFRPPRQMDWRPISVGYLGRITPEKGVDTAVAAMAVLAKRGQAAHLTLAGRAERRATLALRRQIERLCLADRVTLRGFVPRDQVPAMLAEFDVLVVPSVWPEPLARTIQEGMAIGAVVVATPVGGTVEIVEDGVNGLLFAPGDAAALAERIERLSRDAGLRASLAAAGRRTVETRFDLGGTVDAIEEVLRCVAFGPDSRR